MLIYITAAVIDYGTACCIHQLQIQSTSEILISSYMLDMDRVVTLRCDASRCKGLHSPSSTTPTSGKPKGKEGETNRLSSALTSGKWFFLRGVGVGSYIEGGKVAGAADTLESPQVLSLGGWGIERECCSPLSVMTQWLRRSSQVLTWNDRGHKLPVLKIDPRNDDAKLRLCARPGWGKFVKGAFKERFKIRSKPVVITSSDTRITPLNGTQPLLMFQTFIRRFVILIKKKKIIEEATERRITCPWHSNAAAKVQQKKKNPKYIYN